MSPPTIFRRFRIALRVRLLLLLLSTFVSHRAAVAATIAVPADQPTVQDAVNAASSGDVVLLAPGTYPGGIYIQDKSIVIASQFYFTGDTTFIAQTVLHGYGDYCGGFSGCRGDAVLEFGDGTDGSAVIGLTVRDDAVGQYGPYGTKGVRSRSFVDIGYCHVIYTDDGTNYTGGSGGTISNSLFAYNHDDGIDLNSDVEVRVVNNIIRDNRDDGVEFRMNPYSGPTTTIEFIGNLVTGNGEDGIQLIDYADSSHRVVRFERNVFVNNAMAGLGLMADEQTDQDFSGPQIPERIELVNNTFIGGDYQVSGGGNLVAINNIFTGASSYALWRVGTQSTSVYNLFWSNAVDAAESNVDPTGTLHADPLLADDGTLIASSPAVDAGIAFFEWMGGTVLDLQPSDYTGSAPDLGATELNLAGGAEPLLTIDNVTLDEHGFGSQEADFEVRLTEVTPQAVTVDYATFDGTATASDHDYEPRSGTLTIPANTLVAHILVPVHGDVIPEDDEEFTVKLSNAVHASILRGTGTGTIVNDDGDAPSVESRIATGSDDAEESASGNVSLTSSDIEMMIDGNSTQRAAGLRFTALEVPQGVTVLDAWIQFRSKEAWDVPTTLTFRAEAADDAPPFVSVNSGLSTLPVTAAAVTWPDVPGWVAGETTTAQRTPNLGSVIQEVVDRPGWSSGNALAILVTGSGHRTAYAYDGDPAGAALLHVVYTTEAPVNLAPEVAAGPDTTILSNSAAFLHGIVSDDGRPVPGNLDLTWSQLSGPGPVSFDDPHTALTRVTFVNTGIYDLELMASDGELTSSDTMRVEVKDAGGGATVLEVRVAASADDAEEWPNGSVNTGSSDLEMMVDAGTKQPAVGMRFPLAIPNGAVITEAWIQFTTREVHPDTATSLILHAQAIDDAPVFESANNLTSRAVTNAEVPWADVPNWVVVGEAGPDQRTPDLKALVQEVVSRPGWRSDNALAVIVTGAGRRVAYSYDGHPDKAPLLHIEFVAAPPADHPPVAAFASFAVEGAAPFSLTADATPSADPDGDSLQFVFDFGDGTVMGPWATPTATHTYSEGTWLLTLTVTDESGDSDVLSTLITVHPNLVTNGSVEVDLTGWNANGPGASIERIEGGHEGSFCIEARGDSSLSSFGVNDSPNWVSSTDGPGTRYHFSAWVRSDSHSGRARIQVREYLDGVLQGTPHVSQEVELQTGWQPIHLEVEATASGSTLDFQVLDKPQSFGEIFEVDEISAWQAGAPVLAAPTMPFGEGAAFSARVHPNPLGPKATLALVTTRFGFARVRLYDSQGRLVRTLLDDASLPAGRHVFALETRTPRGRLEAGVYFYSVQAAEGRLNGRFVVIE